MIVMDGGAVSKGQMASSCSYLPCFYVRSGEVGTDEANLGGLVRFVQGLVGGSRAGGEVEMI